MKPKIMIILLLLCSINNGFSQSAARPMPTVKQEALNEARFVGDLTPELWRVLVLPTRERAELDYRGRTEYAGGYYIYPQEYNYKAIIDYVSVEISATCKGRMLTAKSESDLLTAAQKKILTAADMGTEITIRVMFKHKDLPGNKPGSDAGIISGQMGVRVVPETEAECALGAIQPVNYLKDYVIAKMPGKGVPSKMLQAMVSFAVNEAGRVVDVKIDRTSGDGNIDLLLMEALHHMPAWKPAKNSKGMPVRQAFSIPLGEIGC